MDNLKRRKLAYNRKVWLNLIESEDQANKFMIKNIKSKGHRGFTGAAGEYLVAAEISRQNTIATITSKNTPNIDILASSIDGERTANIQVKTGRRTTGGFIVGSKPMKPLGKNFFYVFVLLKEIGEFEYWIIPQDIVAETAESAYQNWIKNRSNRSKRAPRTFKWEWLRSKEFNKYHNNWGILRLW